MLIDVKKHYKRHVFLLAALSIQLFILVPIPFINKFLAVAACLGVLLNLKEIKFEFRQWQEILVFVLVNLYLTFAIFGYDLFLEPKPELLLNISYYDVFANAAHVDLQSMLSMAAPYLGVFYLGLGFIWTSYVLQSFLDAIKSLSKFKDKVCAPSNGKYWKKWLILFAIMVPLFMIWQRAFNPIVMSVDSWGYFGDDYRVGRSVLYMFINNLIMRIAPTTPAVEWIGIYQIIIFSCLLSTILMYLHKKWIRYKWIVTAAIILPLIPSLALHTIVVWADLMAGMTVLWFTYVIVRILDEIIINGTAVSRQRISLCIQLCVVMVLLYFAKANTMVVYLITAPVLTALFVLRKQWKLLLPVALSAILVLLIRFPGHTALNADRWPNLDAHKYYAGIHDMQATYYNGGSFSEENLALLKKYISNIDDIRDDFQPDLIRRGDWSNLQDVQESMTTGEFISMYADTFIRNPFQMSRSMLYRSRAYWVIASKGHLSFVNYTDIYDKSTASYTTQAPEIGVYRHPNFLTRVIEKYMLALVLPLPAMFIWRFGIWTALMVISAATLIWQKRYIWLLAYIPVFVHLVTIFLTSGWTDYRYGLPELFVGLFLPLTLFLLNPSFKEVKE